MSDGVAIFINLEDESVETGNVKQSEFDELIKGTNIDRDDLLSIFHMNEAAISSQRPNTTLPSIMLKYVIGYCIAIIADEKYEGYAVSLQTDQVLHGIKNDKLASIPANTQFKVVGVKIPSLFIRSYSKYTLAYYDHVPDDVVALSGRYGLVDQQTAKYTAQRDSFTHPGLPAIGSDKVQFTSDAQALKILDTIISYIEYVERYYRVNYPLLRYDLIEPTDKINSHENWRIINGRVQADSDGSSNSPPAKTKSAIATKPQSSTAKSKSSPTIFTDFSADLLEQLAVAQDGSFGSSFFYDILYMLDANKLTHLYNLGLIVGPESVEFKKELTELKKQLEKTATYRKQINSGHKIQLELIKKKSIAFDKFGETDLNKLTSKQSKVVELEFKRLESTVSESGDKNRMLFSKLVSSLTNQTDEELVKTLREIEKLNSASKLSGEELLVGGVCPHTYQLGKKILQDFVRGQANVQVRDFMIEKYALPVDSNGYFCKICGEMIVEQDTNALMKFSGERGNYVTDDNPIQTMIWKEAMYIISTNVRFTSPVPVKPLVNSLASGLREVIASEENKLYKSKTNTGENIKDTLNLYSAIYIYASLCALMLQNPGKMMFARDPPAEKMRSADGANRSTDTRNSQATAEPVEVSSKSDGKPDESAQSPTLTSEYFDEPTALTPTVSIKSRRDRSTGGSRKSKYKYISGGKVVTDVKLAERFYLTTALKLILLSKETIISRTPNADADSIRNIFINQAYAWASKHVKPIQIDSETERQTGENPLFIDPLYRYIYYAKRLSEGKGPKDLNDAKYVLGRPSDKVLADVKNDVGIFSTVGDIAPWHTKSAIPRFDDYTYRSFMSILEYYRDMIYTKTRIPRHVQVGEYFDKYKDLQDMQFALRMYLAKRHLTPSINIPLTNDIVSKYNNFAPERLDLAQHYCPDGSTHKTGTYIYSVGNSKTTVEVSKKDITEWLDTNNEKKLTEFNKMTLIDEKCQNCGKLVRTAKSFQKSEKALAIMFGKIDDMLALYQYYETRCPKGTVHEITDDKCVKCGYTTELAKKNDATYYDKWKSVFNKTQQEKQALSIKSLAALANEQEYAKPSFKLEYTYSLKKTAEWSQVAGVKYNILANIGLFEGVKYALIESANANPSKTEAPNMSRALRIKGHIHMVLRDYTLVRHYERLVDIPVDLKDIINAQKKIDIKNLATAIPDIADFRELDEKYAANLDLPNYINFLQEYLAGVIVTISSKSHPKFKPMADALVSYFTKAIIAKERFISKPEPYFAKIELAEGSDEETVLSDDEWAGRQSEASEQEFAEEAEVETYENDINNEGFDVENADDIWEND